MKNLSVFSYLFLFFFFSSIFHNVYSAIEGVRIYPKVVKLSPTKRVAKVFVINDSTKPTSVYIEWKYFVMNPNGRLVEGNENENIVRKAVIFAPRIIYLEPGEGQTIRLIYKPHKLIKMKFGEYHSHILILKEPTVAFNVSSIKNKGGKDVGVKLLAKYGFAIPVFIRYGKLEKKLDIRGTLLYNRKGENFLRVIFLNKGNRSIYGKVEVWKGGSKIASLDGFVLYPEVIERKIEIKLNSLLKKKEKITLKVFSTDKEDKDELIFEKDVIL